MKQETIQKHYWNAIGNKEGYFTRKRVVTFIAIFGFPLGTVLIIIGLLYIKLSGVDKTKVIHKKYRCPKL